VKSDNTVEMRPVVSSHAYGGEAVIDSGLERDEVVVIDGQTRLVPKAKVQITNSSGDVSHP